MHKQSILYCGCINNKNIYRKYTSNSQAIASFKRLSITLYAKLTDITKRENGKWSRISWN